MCSEQWWRYLLLFFRFSNNHHLLTYESHCHEKSCHGAILTDFAWLKLSTFVVSTLLSWWKWQMKEKVWKLHEMMISHTLHFFHRSMIQLSSPVTERVFRFNFSLLLEFPSFFVPNDRPSSQHFLYGLNYCFRFTSNTFPCIFARLMRMQHIKRAVNYKTVNNDDYQVRHVSSFSVKIIENFRSDFLKKFLNWIKLKYAAIRRMKFKFKM